MILAWKALLSGNSAKAGKKSPIPFLLNLPGWSTRREGFKKVITIVGTSSFSLGVLIGVFVPSLLLALLVLLLALILDYAWEDDIETYFLGSEGERAVAQALDKLGRPDWRVFHNCQIPEVSGDIDHIVVCPKGVFCVETKTLRKDSDKIRKLRFDGEQIFRGDFPLPYNPFSRAKYTAKMLCNFLQGKGVAFIDFVTPVVIYPGWKFDDNTLTHAHIIFKERQHLQFIFGNRQHLVKFLEGDEDKFSESQIKEIAEVLEEENKITFDE